MYSWWKDTEVMNRFFRGGVDEITAEYEKRQGAVPMRRNRHEQSPDDEGEY